MKLLFPLAAIVLFFTACNKEEQTNDICFDGVVRFAGDPAADGLGWVIYKDDSTTTRPYIPQNLSDEFKVENLKIAACVYETDEKAACRCAEPPNKYRVTSIKRR